MKRLTLLMAALVLVCSTADAQGILGRLEQRARNAAERKVGDKLEQDIEDAIDGNTSRNRRNRNDDEDEPRSKSKSKKSDTWTCPECGTEGNTGKFCNECGAKKPAEDDGTWTCPECGTEGNTGKFCEECGAKNPGDGGEQSVDFAEIKAKSDFVRGGTVFFSDDLSGERMGEFPSKWDLLNGSECEVVSIKGQKAIRIEGTAIAPLMEELKYLPEEFTIEFDVLSQPAMEGSGWDATLDIFFFGENYDGSGEDRVFDYRISVETSGEGSMKGEYNSIAWGWGSWNPNGGKIDGETSSEAIRKVFKKNDWNHIAFSFNKRAFKVYLNYSRIVNIPNQKQPRAWSMDGSSDSDKGVYITNIVMAKGAVELYERNATNYSSAVEKAIAETGKFVTNNILFETGKATLKPESMEEIQKVADYMKKNPTVRFEVQGHTDNQGSDAVNDPLSQQRAEAVVKALESQGVDGFNLRAVGKGSHEPVADNGTEEGRAKNRRVEFIKK